MRVVLDTAILIRANAKATGPAKELFRLIQESGTHLILSPYMLSELERVFQYPRILNLYRLSEADISAFLRTLRSYAEVVEPAEGPPIVIKDSDDDPIVYTAIAGQAEVLCTVDKHFYEPNVLAFCSLHGIQLMTDIELLFALRRLTRLT